jgi:3-hydroxy-5-methyl-1-naphthoate 3-O-methyltransferase
MKTWKPFKRDDQAINTILDMVYGYQKSRALFTACDLDIFSLIGTDYKSASEVAVLLNTDKKATQRLLDALCSMDLLEKKIDKYTNSNISLRFLVKSKPEYMSIMDYSSKLWDAWGTLTEAVKLGKSPVVKEIYELEEDSTEQFIDAVHWRSALLAQDIVRMIDLRDVNTVLDLGGGVGDYAIEFVNAKPNINATIFTYPNCAPFAEDYLKYIKKREIAEKINIITGDMFKDDFGSGYDLVFLSFVIQHFDIWKNMELAKKVYESLNPGGTIVIQDLLIDDKRTSPEFNALFALELLVNSNGGDTYTSSDIWLMLKEAWFDKIKIINTEFGTSLVFGKKNF